jgi:hypothetical protein
MSVILLCRLLPFYAWPLWLRVIVWCLCALGISLAVHRLRIHAVSPSHHGAIQSEGDGMPINGLTDYGGGGGDIVASQQRRLATVRRKLEGLPALRLKGAKVIRCTGEKAPIAAVTPSDGETDPLAVLVNDLRPMDAAVPRDPASDMTCPQVDARAGGVTSGAALLAWIEHIVLASDVALRRFEPVVDDLAQIHRIPQMSGLQQGSSATAKAAMARLAQSTEDALRTDESALREGISNQPMSRAADVEISGSYAGLYRVMERFARTEPPLIVVSSRVRSDEQRIRWEARIVVADAGPFRLGAVAGVMRAATAPDGAPGDAHRAGGENAPNPFARSVLPGAGHAARLIGVMRRGTRNVGLFAYGNKRQLLEVGGMLGDARIVGIHSENGTPRAELAPLTGEPLRVLLLRSRQ